MHTPHFKLPELTLLFATRSRSHAPRHWYRTESLASYFKQFGEIADCVVMRDRVTQAPRGFGFVTYADPSISQHVVTIKHVVDGKEVEAKIAVPRADEAKPLPPPVASVEYSSRKVFVGGLSHETSEGEFREYFEQWGNVVDCVIMIDPNTRKPRGFGFVTYEHALSAEELCSAPFAHELRGKRIEIKRAIPQERMGGPPTAKPAGQVPPSLMQARLPSDSQLRPYQALAPRGASPVANAPVLSTGGGARARRARAEPADASGRPVPLPAGRAQPIRHSSISRWPLTARPTLRAPPPTRSPAPRSRRARRPAAGRLVPAGHRRRGVRAARVPAGAGGCRAALACD